MHSTQRTGETCGSPPFMEQPPPPPPQHCTAGAGLGHLWGRSVGRGGGGGREHSGRGRVISLSQDPHVQHLCPMLGSTFAGPRHTSLATTKSPMPSDRTCAAVQANTCGQTLRRTDFAHRSRPLKRRRVPVRSEVRKCGTALCASARACPHSVDGKGRTWYTENKAEAGDGGNGDVCSRAGVPVGGGGGGGWLEHWWGRHPGTQARSSGCSTSRPAILSWFLIRRAMTATRTPPDDLPIGQLQGHEAPFEH